MFSPDYNKVTMTGHINQRTVLISLKYCFSDVPTSSTWEIKNGWVPVVSIILNNYYCGHSTLLCRPYHSATSVWFVSLFNQCLTPSAHIECLESVDSICFLFVVFRTHSSMLNPVCTQCNLVR